MATEAQLRRRISELQSQIENLRFQNETFQNNIAQQMNERFARMKAEYESALIRQKNETEELYTARIRSFQEQLVRDMQQHYQELEKEAEHIVKSQNEKLEELKSCNEELRTAFQKVKTHSEMVDNSHRMYAVDLLEELKIHKKAAEITPHEFFFQGEFNIIDSYVEQISEEIGQEMYQAAASDLQ